MGNSSSSDTQGNTIDNDIAVEWKELNCIKFIDGQGDGLDSASFFQFRDCHASTVVDSKIYCFGGIIEKNKETGALKETNELTVFDIEKNTFMIMPTDGDKPCPRTACCLSAVGNKLYLMYGFSLNIGWFDDVYEFDLETSKWRKLEPSGNIPSARDKACCAVVNGKIYLFGGFGPVGMTDESVEEESANDEGDDDDDDDDDDSEDEVVDEAELPDDGDGVQFGWFNDLHIFDPAECAWSNPMQMNTCRPSQRAAAAMCAIGIELVIFGGRSVDGRVNDTHIFNTTTRKWRKDMAITGRLPEPRSFHSLSAVGGKCVLFGGRGVSGQHFADLHIFLPDKLQWLQPTVTGTLPSGRASHSADVALGSFVIYGGSSDLDDESQSPSVFFNDVFSVQIEPIMCGQSLNDQASVGAADGKGEADSNSSDANSIPKEDL